MTRQVDGLEPLIIRRRLGTPAIVLGLFLVAAAISSLFVISRSASASIDANASNQLWSYYVAGVGSMIGAIGLMLYRTLVVVDKMTQNVSISKGFSFWQRTKHEQFRAIEAVETVYEKGGSETSDSYDLGLRERTRRVILFSYPDQSRCRRDAEKIAQYLNVPLREG